MNTSCTNYVCLNTNLKYFCKLNSVGKENAYAMTLIWKKVWDDGRSKNLSASPLLFSFPVYQNAPITRVLISLQLPMNSSAYSAGVSPSNEADIDWEMRPGGMFVQRRESGDDDHTDGPMINISVAYGSSQHEVYLPAQSSFCETLFSLCWFCAWIVQTLSFCMNFGY